MAVPINVASIPPFDSHGEQNSVAHRWEKWLKAAPLLFRAHSSMQTLGHNCFDSNAMAVKLCEKLQLSFRNDMIELIFLVVIKLK